MDTGQYWNVTGGTLGTITKGTAIPFSQAAVMCAIFMLNCEYSTVTISNSNVRGRIYKSDGTLGTVQGANKDVSDAVVLVVPTNGAYNITFN